MLWRRSKSLERDDEGVGRSEECNTPRHESSLKGARCRVTNRHAVGRRIAFDGKEEAKHRGDGGKQVAPKSSMLS